MREQENRGHFLPASSPCLPGQQQPKRWERTRLAPVLGREQSIYPAITVGRAQTGPERVKKTWPLETETANWSCALPLAGFVASGKWLCLSEPHLLSPSRGWSSLALSRLTMFDFSWPQERELPPTGQVTFTSLSQLPSLENGVHNRASSYAVNITHPHKALPIAGITQYFLLLLTEPPFAQGETEAIMVILTPAATDIH